MKVFLIFLFICSGLMEYDVLKLHHKVNELTVRQESDIAESRQREENMGKIITPELITALKEFTQEVQTENAYLKKFSEDKGENKNEHTKP